MKAAIPLLSPPPPLLLLLLLLLLLPLLSLLRSRVQVRPLLQEGGEKMILHNQESDSHRSTDSAGVVTMSM